MTDFGLSSEEIQFRDSVRAFVDREIAPNATRWDIEERYPREMFARAGALGWLAVGFPEAVGGSGGGPVMAAILNAELTRGSAAISLGLYVHSMLASAAIHHLGDSDQNARLLPDALAGRRIGCWGYAEADAGADITCVKTRARRDGEVYVLNGAKLYITSAEYAGIFVVWAVTDPTAPKGKGISCFLIEAGTPGMSIGKPEKKMGQTGSSTCEVRFDDCKLPADALMGKENDGFRIAVSELAGGRIGIASLALGIARAAMDQAIAYVKEREQFGKKLAEMQGLQWMIADRETDLEAARLLIAKAAHLKDSGQPFAQAASMAKLFASEAAQRATYAALQMHGGAGYISDLPLERFARDARITTIYEGTSEIQRLIIARNILAAH